jgi:hypothetical protein
MKNITVDKGKFDAVLRRMATMKPMSVKELSAKLKAEKAAKAEREMAEARAKIAARRVQKMDK